MPKNPRLIFDRRRLDGGDWLIGVDEVGRGAIAGPLMTCAVCIHRSFYEQCPMPRGAGKINDSKLLKPDIREALLDPINAWAAGGYLFYTFGSASPQEVDEFNTFGATVLAMGRALDALAREANGRCELVRSDALSKGSGRSFARVVIDGIPLRNLAYRHDAVPRGDQRSLAVAMSSIIAKVSRDRLMVSLAVRYPHYCFSSNKGYRSPDHKRGLAQHGPCEIHRRRLVANVNLTSIEGTLPLHFPH